MSNDTQPQQAKPTFPLAEAQTIAISIVNVLEPHCERICIAGSIRRRKPECRDVEIVLIPKPYQTGLFEDGIAKVINAWEKVKGEPGPEMRYTQRIHPSGIKIDIFVATRDTWGLILIYRTGSTAFNLRWLHEAKTRGYRMAEGKFFYRSNEILLPEERDLFTRIGMPFIRPEERG